MYRGMPLFDLRRGDEYDVVELNVATPTDPLHKVRNTNGMDGWVKAKNVDEVVPASQESEELPLSQSPEKKRRRSGGSQ